MTVEELLAGWGFEQLGDGRIIVRKENGFEVTIDEGRDATSSELILYYLAQDIIERTQ